MLYLGIDPGKNGGIAWMRQQGETCVVNAVPMSATLRDLSDLLASLAETSNLRSCAIEKVASRPGQGVKSCFTFGYQYGIVCATVVCNRISLDRISPRKWQTPFCLVMDGTVPRTLKKNKHKAKAQELFPHLKITHATADALLICEYWRRYHQASSRLAQVE